MAGKILVYGKAQNRTALGVLHAYLVMNPKVTLDGLRNAFPNSLCPDAGVKQLLLPVAEAETFNTNMSLYFTKPDEVLNLADGTVVALAQVWSKSSLEKLVARAADYEIEVAAVDKVGRFERGGYRLEYLNGYQPHVDAPKKSLWWLWLLLLLGIGGAAWCLLFGKEEAPAPEPQVVEKVVEKEVVREVVIRDTVFVQQIEDIQREFNAAQFEQGKADLNDDAKLALHDLARVLRQNPQMRLRIEGHTSAEGDAAANRRLSEQRAMATVDFLVNKEGIDSVRLDAAGKGSDELKDADNPNSEVNRRTEFIIIEE